MLARALAGNPGLHLIAVLPRFPDQDGKLSLPPNLLGRATALAALRAAGGDRVAVYSPENAAGTPIYVHAKVCVVDDTWAIVGSDNFNRRSWTHDSELSCAVIDEAGTAGDVAAPAGAARYPQALRAALAREHLGAAAEGADDGGAGIYAGVPARRAGTRRLARGRPARATPPGQLRTYSDPELPPWTRTWASVPYRLIYDPDGRPLSWRRAGRF